MEKSFVFIDVDCLFRFIEKEKKVEIKKQFLSRFFGKFEFLKQSGNFASCLEMQVSRFIKEKLEDFSIFDFQMFKPVEESLQVLDELRLAGFKVIITSDSSYRPRVSGLLRNFGFDQKFDRLVTYEDLNVKKSDENYFEQIKIFCEIQENDEIFVVSTKLNKEILNAYRKNVKHIWINQEVNDLVEIM